jgi:hypothetical protein
MKEVKKEKVMSDTPTAFGEHVLSIIEEETARNKFKMKKTHFLSLKTIVRAAQKYCGSNVLACALHRPTTFQT